TFFARFTFIFPPDLRAQSCSLFFLTSARFFTRRQTQFSPARFISLLALDAPLANCHQVTISQGPGGLRCRLNDHGRLVSVFEETAGRFMVGALGSGYINQDQL